MTGRPEFLKYSLHIPQRTNKIGKDHIIKSFGEVKVFGVQYPEIQFRMSFPCYFNDPGREIDSQPEGRPDRRQEITHPASQLQHPGVGRNKKRIAFFQQTVVIPVSPSPIGNL